MLLDSQVDIRGDVEHLEDLVQARLAGGMADPSISLVLGFLGWVVAMLAAAVAFRGSGASWPVTILVGLSALFAIHPPPIGPLGLVCFAVASVLIERGRARGTRAAENTSAGLMPAGTTT